MLHVFVNVTHNEIKRVTMSMFMSLSENLGFLDKRPKPNARTLVSSTRIFYFQILQYS